MNGAETLLTTARDLGVTTCFANPGTTEMPLVRALDSTEGIQAVLCLSEGVVTGAADGYARMAGEPAMTLLHLGPGFANGIANLHNARRARIPVLNVVGEHASWHQCADPPLASDIDSLASPVCGWVGRTTRPPAVAEELAAAWREACTRRAPAALIAASDHLWGTADGPATRPELPTAAVPDDQRLSTTAKALADGRRPALLLGDAALSAAGLELAAGIAAATGARLFTEGTPARLERGPGIPEVAALPYFPEDVLDTLDGVSDLVLVGAREPVSFFGYRGLPSSPVPPRTSVHLLAEPGENAVQGLRELALRTGTGEIPAPEVPPVSAPEGELNAKAVARAVVCTQPDNAVIVNEGVSAAGAYPAVAAAAPRHTELGLTGGAIGIGIPLATGAAIASPRRPVIDLQADGSGLYTPQGLWTQARMGLDVTTVVFANHRYRILDAELRRAGVTESGPAAAALTELSGPGVDWVSLAESFGVTATRATSGEELTAALRDAHGAPGPHLVEAVLR